MVWCECYMPRLLRQASAFASDALGERNQRTIFMVSQSALPRRASFSPRYEAEGFVMHPRRGSFASWLGDGLGVIASGA